MASNTESSISSKLRLTKEQKERVHITATVLLIIYSVGLLALIAYLTYKYTDEMVKRLDLLLGTAISMLNALVGFYFGKRLT